MWDLAVAVVQLACLAILAAGAILSLWFARTDQEREEPEVKSQPAARTEAVVKPERKLKRAA